MYSDNNVWDERLAELITETKTRRILFRPPTPTHTNRKNFVFISETDSFFFSGTVYASARARAQQNLWRSQIILRITPPLNQSTLSRICTEFCSCSKNEGHACSIRLRQKSRYCIYFKTQSTSQFCILLLYPSPKKREEKKINFHKATNEYSFQKPSGWGSLRCHFIILWLFAQKSKAGTHLNSKKMLSDSRILLCERCGRESAKWNAKLK